MTRASVVAAVGLAGTVVLGSLTAGAALAVQQAEVSGIVVTSGALSTPLARAVVTISGPTLTPSKSSVTDDQGQFSFQGLPPGRFTIVAARAPYVRTAFGARRPGQPGTPIDLTEGQRVVGLTLRLARGAAIMGVVRHADGDGAPDVRVEATSFGAQGGTAGSAVTDDRGVYRIFGLPPGPYLVSSAVTDGGRSLLTRFSEEEMDAILLGLERRGAGASSLRGPSAGPDSVGQGPGRSNVNARPVTYGYAPIYYPGTPDRDQAVTLALAEGEERAGVDLSLQLVRTATIEGRVASAVGALPSNTQIALTRHGPWERASRTFTPSTMRRPDSSGAFEFTGIPPGRYRVAVRSVTTTPLEPSGAAPATPASATTPSSFLVTGVLWATADILIHGEDITGLALTLQRGLTLSGRVVFDSRDPKPSGDVGGLRPRLVELDGAPVVTASTEARADGTFEIGGIPAGAYRLVAPLNESRWWLRSVMLNGRDVLDFPLEIGATGDVTGAVATFTDRRTELSGTLQSAGRVAAPEHFVVVFSADRTYWQPGSRRVQFTRPSTDGRFAVRDLPAGDYLVGALSDLEPPDLADVSFLERLAAAAIPVHLEDGEKKIQDLRIAP